MLGDSDTGKTHLLIGLGLAACEQGRRVRYATTAQLVNELAEAADQRQLSRVVGRVTFNVHIVETGTQSYRLARQQDQQSQVIQLAFE